jgi:hypothetical protein
VSSFGDVPTAILEAVGNAITLGGSRDGFQRYEDIPPDQFPFAMIFNPIKEQARGDFQHGEETTINPLLVVYSGATIATINADMVLIEAEIISDPTLGGEVEDAWVATAGRDESLDSDFTVAVFQIDTRGSV